MTSATHEERLGERDDYAELLQRLRAATDDDVAAILSNNFNVVLGALAAPTTLIRNATLEEAAQAVEADLEHYQVRMEVAARIRALKEQPPARFEGQSERRWRHVTSGMSVTEIGRGRMQTAEPVGDMTPIVIYHHAGDAGIGGTFWARPAAEFEDRFVEPPPPLAEEGKP